MTLPRVAFATHQKSPQPSDDDRLVADALGRRGGYLRRRDRARLARSSPSKVMTADRRHATTSLLPRRYKTVPGRHYGTPKELWGFRTSEVRGTPAAVARRFLRDSAALLGIQSVRSCPRLARVVESVGAAHVIESHFQLDGFTSFAKGARAIRDADRHLFGGRHVAALRGMCHEQGIGPVE